MTRWFTDAAAIRPAPVRPVLTASEQQTLTQLLEFAKDPANHEMELMHCLDAAGGALQETSTGKKAAPITAEMFSRIDAGGGVRLWHNHPSNDSLSAQDWLCAGYSEQLEVLALNSRGSLFMGRIVDWDDRFHGLLAWLPRLAGDLELHMDRLATTCGLHPDYKVALARFTGHVLNCALASVVTVRYAFAMLPPEQAVLTACGAHGIIADGEAFARAAIQQWLSDNPATTGVSGRPAGVDELDGA